MVPLTLLIPAMPASAGQGYGPMKCEQRKPQSTWPGNGHFWTCVKGDKNQDYRVVFSAANGLPDMVFNVLRKADVRLLFFYDRSQANEALIHQFGLSRGYTTQTAHCGNTYVAGFSKSPIVSVVYYKCDIKGSELGVNPNLRETTLHEMGHAFDFALSRLKGLRLFAEPPSRSAAYKDEVRADLDILDRKWKADPQPDAYVCSLTETVVPSKLEIALGASPGSVCELTKKGVKIRAAYAGKEPSAILREKCPISCFPRPAPAAPPPAEKSQYPPGCPVEPVEKYWGS